MDWMQPIREEMPVIQVAGRRPGLKSVLMVVAILVAEAAAIVGAFRFFGFRPQPASALDLPPALRDSNDGVIVELPVLEARLTNSRTGATYIYECEMYVQVKKRLAPHVESVLDQFRHEIQAEISAIWRTAEPRHFDEPKLHTLTRKVYALLDERLGRDEARNEPVILQVVIVMGAGFRID